MYVYEKTVKDIEHIKEYFDRHREAIEKAVPDDNKSLLDDIYESFPKKLSGIYKDIEIIEDQERPLRVAIAGKIKAGKSTLINSLIEEELLGMNVLPATAKVTVLRYGDEQKIEKVYKNGDIKVIGQDEYRMYSLHNYDEHCNTEQQPSDFQEVEEFIVYFPSDVLRNINIHDTPGFGNTVEDEEETKRGCTKADVIIWICNVEKGTIQADEMKWIKKIVEDKKPLFIVINYIEKKISSDSDTNNPKVEKIKNKIDKETTNEGIEVSSICLYTAKTIFESVIPNRARKKKVESFINSIKDNYLKDFTIKLCGSSLTMLNSENKVLSSDKLPDVSTSNFIGLRTILLNELESIKGKRKEYQLKALVTQTKVTKKHYFSELTKVKLYLDDVLKSTRNRYNIIEENIKRDKRQFKKYVHDVSKRMIRGLETDIFNEWFVFKGKKYVWEANSIKLTKVKSISKKMFMKYCNGVDEEFEGIVMHYQQYLKGNSFLYDNEEYFKRITEQLAKFCIDSFQALRMAFQTVEDPHSWAGDALKIKFGKDSRNELTDIIQQLIPDKVLYEEILQHYLVLFDDLKHQIVNAYRYDRDRFHKAIDDYRACRKTIKEA